MVGSDALVLEFTPWIALRLGVALGVLTLTGYLLFGGRPERRDAPFHKIRVYLKHRRWWVLAVLVAFSAHLVALRVEEAALQQELVVLRAEQKKLRQLLGGATNKSSEQGLHPNRIERKQKADVSQTEKDGSGDVVTPGTGPAESEEADPRRARSRDGAQLASTGAREGSLDIEKTRPSLGQLIADVSWFVLLGVVALGIRDICKRADGYQIIGGWGFHNITLRYLGVLLAGYALCCFLSAVLASNPGSEVYKHMNNWFVGLSGVRIAVWDFLRAGLISAVMEEAVTKGVILGLVSGYARPYAAVIVSAGMFALMHSSGRIDAVLLLFATGQAWLFIRTGSLTACILVHSVINIVIVGGLFVLQATGQTEAYNVIPSILVYGTAVLVVGAFVLLQTWGRLEPQGGR